MAEPSRGEASTSGIVPTSKLSLRAADKRWPSHRWRSTTFCSCNGNKESSLDPWFCIYGPVTVVHVSYSLWTLGSVAMDPSPVLVSSGQQQLRLSGRVVCGLRQELRRHRLRCPEGDARGVRCKYKPDRTQSVPLDFWPGNALQCSTRHL